uniref:MATH domain-containing protein n=1 Tax=Acrobeloides nanus TaxID=290746 RepID=A0A914DZE6_9BILA
MSILGKTEFRIRWTPDSAEYWPSVHFVAGHSWSVCMKYHSNEQTGHMPFLSIYIYCNKDRTMPSGWQCKARTQFSIIPRSKYERQITKRILQVICKYKLTEFVIAQTSKRNLHDQGGTPTIYLWRTSTVL